MQIKGVLSLAAVMLIAGCSTTTPLTSGGQQVKFTETKPGTECHLLGTAQGTKSNWLSGQGGEASSMREAANDLRNRAAAMGGNVVYGAVSPTEGIISDFVPLDSKMIGQVYKCPDR